MLTARQGESDEDNLPLKIRHLDRSNGRDKADMSRRENFASWSLGSRPSLEVSQIPFLKMLD